MFKAVNFYIKQTIALLMFLNLNAKRGYLRRIKKVGGSNTCPLLSCLRVLVISGVIFEIFKERKPGTRDFWTS